MADVSGNPYRPPVRDRQKRMKPAKSKSVGIAVVRYEGISAGCSCGWTTIHPRDKVREDAIDKHLNKKHDGRGIRL